jgi:transposase-like protein
MTSSPTCTSRGITGASCIPLNTLERIHKEIKRRTRVVGIFPNRDSLMRMVATLLQEQDDEWQVMDRRYFSIESMRRINEQLEGRETPKELLAAIA